MASRLIFLSPDSNSRRIPGIELSSLHNVFDLHHSTREGAGHNIHQVKAEEGLPRRYRDMTASTVRPSPWRPASLPPSLVSLSLQVRCKALRATLPVRWRTSSV